VQVTTAIRKTAPAPRAIGALKLRVRSSVRGTEIADLRHSGSMRVLFPRQQNAALTAVMMNTAGGITGGDRFTTTAQAEAESRLTLTTQAAERAYRAGVGEVGEVSVSLQAVAGGRIDWLPQETILYDGCSLRRSFDARLAKDATLLAVEPLVFGRVAMGEVLRQVDFYDRWRVRVEGKLVFADNLRLAGDAQEQLQRVAVAGGARAMASVLLVAPNAEAFLESVRDALGAAGGASLIRPGVLFARILADDSYLVRRQLMPVLQLLNQADLPRTWMI